MKLCIITHNLPFGTYEAFVIPEIKFFIDAGHQITIIPLRPEGAVVHEDSKELLPYSIKLPLWNAEIMETAIREAIKNPRAVKKAFAIVAKSRNISVFIKNLAVIPKSLWLVNYLQRTGIPDHIHSHWINASATMGMIAAGVLNVPWSITAHRKDIMVNNLIIEKVKACAFVRCINENGAKEIRHLVGPEKKIQVIHMGVNIPKRQPQSIFPRNDKAFFKIVMPANFVEVKGHTYLIQAVRILCDQRIPIRLELAGQGYLKKNIQGQVIKLGLSGCVTFLGEVSHSTLLEKLLYGFYDCVVLPSIITPNGDKEGIPVSLIEAMAAGVPVVSTNTGGIPELCAKGTAILVEPGDAAALAEAIKRLVDDCEGKERMIDLARMRVAEHFNIRSIGPRLLENFKS